MAKSRLPNLDLNLLVTLDAVLEHQSVSRAAEHLGVTQPAVSAALARLRRHFDDKILFRTGNRYMLTPFGVGLRRRTRVAVNDVERVFSSRATFRAAEFPREFSIMASDYAIAVLGTRLAELLTAGAPHSRLRFVSITPDQVVRAEETLACHDIMLLPHGFVTDLPNQTIFHDDWVVVTRQRPSRGRPGHHRGRPADTTVGSRLSQPNRLDAGSSSIAHARHRTALEYRHRGLSDGSWPGHRQRPHRPHSPSATGSSRCPRRTDGTSLSGPDRPARASHVVAPDKNRRARTYVPSDDY